MTEIALKLPEVEPSTWYGTASFKVRGKSFLRLKEEDVMVAMVDQDEKQALIASEPETFFSTPHYDGYPAMLVRLSAIEGDELREVVTEAWRRKAPKRLVKDFDEAIGDGLNVSSS